jgi:hypothetical protein
MSGSRRQPARPYQPEQRVERPSRDTPELDHLIAAGVGKRIMQADSWATVGLAVSTALGAMTKSLAVVAAAVAGTMFVLGSATLLLAFARAVQRSRTDAVGLTGLFWGTGSTPRLLQRHFRRLLGAQSVIGLAGAASRPFTAMAACVLAPMFGLGCLALWSARYGVFGPRDIDPRLKASERAADQPE